MLQGEELWIWNNHNRFWHNSFLGLKIYCKIDWCEYGQFILCPENFRKISEVLKEAEVNMLLNHTEYLSLVFSVRFYF